MGFIGTRNAGRKEATICVFFNKLFRFFLDRLNKVCYIYRNIVNVLSRQERKEMV